MLKKVIILCLMMSFGLLAADNSKKESVENKIKKYNEYKALVAANREKEIKLNTPSKEEVEIELMRDKLEFDKKLAWEKEQRERRRDNLVNTVIIGGIGYGGYRIGRHHRWW